MKSFGWLMLPLALAACSANVDAPNADGKTTSAVTASEDTKAEIARLKTEIRAIAYANTSNVDNLEQVRGELNPLVARLSELYGTPTVEQELPTLAGAWRQIWSDDFRPNPPLITLDLERTYQIVTDKGYFYNLSDSKVLFCTLGGGLRGKYTSNGRGLDIEFTKFGTLLTALPDASELVQLVSDIEAGNRSLIQPPGGNGPVGIQGKIENVFLDDDFRIARGGTAEQNYNRFYILDRAGR